MQWSNDYQKWEDEEDEAGEKQLDSEIKLEPTRSHISFKDMMKKLFSSRKFQVRQNKPRPKGNKYRTWPKVPVTAEPVWDRARGGLGAAPSLGVLVVPARVAAAFELSRPVGNKLLCSRCRCFLSGDKPQCMLVAAWVEARALPRLELPETPPVTPSGGKWLGLVGSQEVSYRQDFAGITHRPGAEGVGVLGGSNRKLHEI